MKAASATLAACALALVACGDDATDEHRQRIEARCVKQVVAQASELSETAAGFDKWNRLAADQRACVDELSEAAADSD